MKITIRLIVWVIVVSLILMIPLVTLFSNEVSRGEGFAYCVILLAVGGFYEIVMWLRTKDRMYRIAFGIGLVGAFLLFWANGAVGIIGSEDNPANLMYGAIFAVGLIGSLISRFKTRGMAYTLFAAALVQILIPVVALFIWPAKASWGEAGVIAVILLNSIFAMVFFGVSGFLFLRATPRDFYRQITSTTDE